MFFVHPQIKLDQKNMKKVFFGFLKNPDLDSLERKLSFMFPDKKFAFVDMGRSAFKIIVEKLNLKDSKIALPAYICDIFYPILKKYNLSPVFLDIDINSFNVDINEIRKKVSPDVKSILVSHTYGLPFNIKDVREIGKLTVIEDCAHCFGAREGDVFLGNLGDVSFFSTYKQFPTFRGGLLIYPKDWEIELLKTSFGFRDFISFLNSFSFFAFLFKKFGQKIAPKMVRKEKMVEPSNLNSVSLNFFSYFLEDFEENLKKRIDLALLFQKELTNLGFEVQESKNNVFCYLSALVPKNMKEKRDKLVQELRKENVFCTRIWHTPIILNEKVQKEYQINLNDFPNTVEAAKRIINFPLQDYYTESDIKVMVKAIKNSLSYL